MGSESITLVRRVAKVSGGYGIRIPAPIGKLLYRKRVLVTIQELPEQGDDSGEG